MIVISCTKKLFETSGFKTSPVPEVGYNPLYSWHANIFRIGRRNCVMLMNDLTRYQVVFYGMKKEHYNNFEQIFFENLELVMKADNFTESEINKFLGDSGKVIYTKTHSRSLLGSLKDQINMTEFMIENYLPSTDLNIVELNCALNQSVILKLKDIYPKVALKNALQE